MDISHLRHSLAHLLAAAVLDLYPGTKNAIGPAIEDGFYYDFEFKKPISEKDLPKIEKRMREILKTWKNFERIEVSANQARELFKDNPYKLEIIDQLEKEGQTITLYQSGNFVDLCKGGHIENISLIDPQSFKLDRIAGAYWRGKETNPMLSRIYGLAFRTSKELEHYLEIRKEAKKRDHKKLGVELDLFCFSDLVGAGLPLWTPKGTIIRNILDDFVWQLRKEAGYEQVDIPHLAKKDLYEKSGHWEKFKEDLFKIVSRENHLFVLKPMNCPHHIQIYSRKLHSYKDLPVRYCTTTKVYRDEQSGELSGLARVRAITQDDAHVFCRKSQVKQEINRIWDIVEKFYGAVKFDLKVRLSLRDPKNPKNYIGTPKIWEKAEQELRTLAKEHEVKAIEAKGEAAFYGPKIDFLAKDSLEREWQVATIQLDMNMPERFDLVCINEKGKKERIVMIHAAIMGSIERYLAVLIEHFGGNFPLWLAPEQVRVLPISQESTKYGKEVLAKLHSFGLRAEIDESNETISKKIRSAELQKIPYLLIVGKKELKNQTISVRKRKAGDQGSMKLKEFIAKILQEIKEKA